jgi:hypothetical protein
LGLVAGWIVALSPARFAAFATAVPILRNSELGLDVAIPTFRAATGPAATPAPRAIVASMLRIGSSRLAPRFRVLMRVSLCKICASRLPSLEGNARAIIARRGRRQGGALGLRATPNGR